MRVVGVSRRDAHRRPQRQKAATVISIDVAWGQPYRQKRKHCMLAKIYNKL